MSSPFLMLEGAQVTPGRRPGARPHAPLPPFDPSDGSGEVHTELPPEQIIPPHFADPTFMRADFTGGTLEGHFEHENPSNLKAQSAAIIAAGGTHITTGRWTGLWIPFLQEANTTPPTMIMTPMLIMYPKDVQDAVLTEHAERGYDDMITAPEPWGGEANGKSYTPAEMLAWCRYLRDVWGFRNVIWRGDPRSGIDEMFRTMIDSGVVSFYIHGEEVDGKMTAEAFEASLQQVDRYINGRVMIGVHFTTDQMPPDGRGLGYPIGWPRDTFINDWSPYDGRVHLCLQLTVDASAGLQGASMYYARRYVNLGAASGVDGAKGPGAPNSRIMALETMATAQLYGRCTEEYGCLRSWELFCGTRTDPRIRAVSGSGNGLRYPNGDPL